MRIKHKKRVKKPRKDQGKEEGSPEKVKGDHQKTLHEIRLINDSVAYSPFPIPKAMGDGRVKGMG